MEDSDHYKSDYMLETPKAFCANYAKIKRMEQWAISRKPTGSWI